MSENDERNEMLFGCLFQFIFYGLWIFGIFRGFNHDTKRGVAAVLLPPYACYKGAAVLWEEPKWKKKWENKTRVVGLMLFNTAGDGENLKKQIILEGVVPEIRDWVDDLPHKERVKLEKSAVALCEANWEYQKKLLRKSFLFEGNEVSEDGRLGELINELSNVPAFKERYLEIKQNFKLVSSVMEPEYLKIVKQRFPDAPSIDTHTGLPNGVEEEKISDLLKNPEYQRMANQVWRNGHPPAEKIGRLRTDRLLKDLFGPASGVTQNMPEQPGLFEDAPDELGSSKLPQEPAEGKSITKEDVAGSYEANIEGIILKYVLFEHGKIEVHQNGEKKEDAKWEMVGKEIHADRGGGNVGILGIEANGDLTIIARIRNGKREEGPKEVRTTFKKIQ